MKKGIIISLFITLCFVLISCGVPKQAESGMTENNVQKELTPIEALTEDEMILFEALKNISYDFFAPSEMKLIEVGDYDLYFYRAYDSDTHKLGKGRFNTITVRLQGENKVGGTLSHYYVIRLDTDEYYIVENPEETVYNLIEEDLADWDNCPPDEYPRNSSNFDSRYDYERFLNSYYAGNYCTEEYSQENFGNYYEDENIHSIEISAEDTYNISKINKALEYYWNDKLGIS